MQTRRYASLSLLLACLILQFDHAVAAYSNGGKFMYSLSTEFNSGALDMTMTSEGCANNCEVGDSIVQSGDLTIYEEFDSTICVSIELTLFSSTSTATGTADFCDEYHVTSIDGSSECPSPGEYTFEADITVTSLSNGLSMTINEHIYSCDGSGDVDITISGTIASVNAMVYSGLGIAGLLTAIVAYRRRRRVLTEQDVSTTRSTEFVQMNDESSAYVVA
ncbi:MAG: hypothetical protein SGARI_005825 [Bacillariaceae sp.]